MPTFPIITLADGSISDPAWFADITSAVNDHETRITTVETFNSRVIRKTANQTVNNSAALVNDTHLLASTLANTDYAFEVNLFYTSGVTPDLKVALTWPTGATCSWMAVGFLSTGINYEIDLTTSTYQGASGTAQAYSGSASPTVTMQIKGILRVAATAGNLQFQFAQNTANASNTTVKQDSWMRIERVTV